MAIGNYHCQRNIRLHGVSIARTYQVEFRAIGIIRCVLLNTCSFSNLASFWVLSTMSAIA
jgi:hypothetical protein